PSGAGATVATVAAGVMVQAAIGTVADRLAGEGIGNVARIAPVGAGVAMVGGKLVEQGLESLGLGNEAARQFGVGTAVAIGVSAPVAVAVLGAQVVGKGVELAIKAVAGEAAERAVAGAVSQLDPTLPGSAANTVVSVAAAPVKALGSLVGIGGDS